MVKVLNHLYYSIFCCFHLLNFLFVPNEGAVSKEGKSYECEYETWRALKINADYETDISSSSSYAVLIVAYFVMVYIAVPKFLPLFCIEPHVDIVLFFLCVFIGTIICYCASFRKDRYKDYFMQFARQDAATRFCWHLLSFFEVCMLVFGFYIVA